MSLGAARGLNDLRAGLSGRIACVAGLGVTGESAVRALHHLGAEVVVVEAAPQRQAERIDRLRADGIAVRIVEDLPASTALLLVSPGWRPSEPLVVAAADAGVPVWGDAELARRLNPELPWLAVTGTNGKTTTVHMLTQMLLAAGHRAVSAGNVGTPLLDVVTGGDVDVVAVELSSFQLHYSQRVDAVASAVLNVSDDHLDWHGSMAQYAADKGRIHRSTTTAAIYNLADPVTFEVISATGAGCRRVGFTLGMPAVDQIGVVEDLIVDRAFTADPTEAVELARLADVKPPAPHNVANALAAAALARAFGVPPTAISGGLRAFSPQPHRLAHVATHRGVAFVNDSKATNPHAAQAALASFDSIVWIAGGLAKGAAFDQLAATAGSRIRCAVLIGTDRGLIAEAFRRHAPHVHLIEVPETDNTVMERAVTAAAMAANPGDTVLLAPACASMDLFTDYADRGRAFVAAVDRLDG
jgi:UDP-N-acetylmuramoylalanine--D-glutamate ligase